MGIFDKLAQSLVPCVHNWTTLTTMQDHPTLPSTVKIVQACDFCAKQRTITETMAVVRPHEHKFEDVNAVKLVGDFLEDNTGSKQQRALKGTVYHQRCSCGDMRSVVVGLAPRDAKGYGYGIDDLAPLLLPEEIVKDVQEMARKAYAERKAKKEQAKKADEASVHDIHERKSA